ncbi:ArsR family transcriptional regulator [Brevibacillus fluminis]|uniref:ArsR family transcriptional regulator n=1 Tax=Brevibacillus fluminis TaxID=511487 RepID=A0A3M8DXF7_9BACL|nr:winged helix-turn-helix domain-containing protein [Brevibacillus fluminis]RNB91667.1 ArsR family transcriptional regulator [Brevibacillus fluminis]
MAYKLIVDSSPVYELVTSFYTFIHWKQMKHARLGSEWRDQVGRGLSTSFAQELSDERWEVLHRINLLVGLCPEKDSVSAFLNWLAAQSPGDIYERLAPWVDSIPANLEDIRDQSVYLLSEWNRHYFQTVDSTLIEGLHQDASEKRQLADTLPALEVVDLATNGMLIEPVSELQTVYLIPQYHCHPYAIIDFHRSVCTCLYPSRLLDERLNQPSWTLQDATQSLADDKRLKILRFIARQPCSFSDIQQYIGLAKSTVNHHLSLLRRAGMIHAHYAGHSTAQRYSLRPRGFETLHQLLQTFIFPANQEGGR